MITPIDQHTLPASVGLYRLFVTAGLRSIDENNPEIHTNLFLGIPVYTFQLLSSNNQPYQEIEWK